MRFLSSPLSIFQKESHTDKQKGKQTLFIGLREKYCQVAQIGSAQFPRLWAFALSESRGSFFAQPYILGVSNLRHKSRFFGKMIKFWPLPVYNHRADEFPVEELPASCEETTVTVLSRIPPERRVEIVEPTETSATWAIRRPETSNVRE